MLNCIIDTTLPNSGTKRPSTPASFMRRSVGSGFLSEHSMLQEDAVGLGIVAQLVVDQPQRAAQQPHRVGMEEGARLLGPGEEADQVDGIALEHVGVGDVQPAVVDAEIAVGADAAPGAPAQRIEQLREPGDGLTCSISSAEHRMVVRSPTSLATRK